MKNSYGINFLKPKNNKKWLKIVNFFVLLMMVLNLSSFGMFYDAEEVLACHGDIIIKKVTDPSDSTDSFSFTSSFGNYSLSNGGEKPFYFTSEREYVFTELAKDGWDLNDVSCDGPYEYDVDLDAGSLTLDITGDGAVECTFYNEEECNICDGKVSNLTLEYKSSEESLITVKQRDGAVVYNDNVAPDETFTFFGQDNQNTLSSEIDVLVNGVLNANFHTSCSLPIGPGIVSGDFLVVSGASRNNGRLCPADPYCGDFNVGEGEECDDGNNVDGDGCSSECTKENITVKAYKVVCENETYLPDWGLSGTQAEEPSMVTANTAADFVAANSPQCWLETDWDFQWGYRGTDGVQKLPGDHVGAADGSADVGTDTGSDHNDWKNFDTSTGAAGDPAVVEIADMDGATAVWVRENLKDGYFPFVNPPGDNQNPVSAELYCEGDILNFDNYDYINNVELGKTYHCIALNALDTQDPYCGDGNTDPDEQCDDGNDNNLDSCRNDCTLADCGDGIPDPGEECDDNGNNGLVCSAPYGGTCTYCSNICTEITLTGPYCGDGVKNGNEECDGDVGLGAYESCTNECKITKNNYCGDGIVADDEECDWNGDNGLVCTAPYGGSCTYCSNVCSEITLTGPYCGDGVKNGDEECDGDSGVPEDYTCLDTCELKYIPPKGSITVCKIEDQDGELYTTNDQLAVNDWPFDVKLGDLNLDGRTGETGCKKFSELEAGTYTVSEPSVDGWIMLDPETGTMDVTITPGEDKTVTFYNTRYGDQNSICGYKYEDEDANFETVNSKGLPDWEIKLYGTAKCNTNDKWADSVVSYTPGLDKDGNPLTIERTDTVNALGEAEMDDTLNFTTLGFGGEIVLHFEKLIINQDGSDLEIYETSYGSPNPLDYPEKVRVYASMTGEDGSWVELGVVTLDGALDLGTLNWASYIKLTDVSDPAAFSEGDGYDLDGIRVLHCGYKWAEPNTTLTDSEGRYCFNGLARGLYWVEETLQDGWFNTTPLSYDLILASADPVERNFNNYEPGSIAGYKFEDADASLSTKDDWTGVADWTIYLYDNEAMTTPISIATTTADGTYSFNDLEPGTYYLAEEMKSGWFQLDGPVNPFVVNSGDELKDNNFINAQTEDEPYCGNGIKEAGEQCDDGNNTNGDGCSSVCTTEGGGGGGGGGGSVSLAIVDLEAQCVSGDTAIVKWRTNMSATSWVVYGKNSNDIADATSTETTTTATMHSKTISGLTPSVEYFFDATASRGGKHTKKRVYFNTDSCVIVKGEEGEPVLTIDKIVDREIVKPGDANVIYNITVRNEGNLTAFNVKLTDLLPEGLWFIDHTEQERNWSLGDMVPGAEKILTYTVKVDSEAEPKDYINIAKVRADNHDFKEDIAEVVIKPIPILPESGFSPEELLGLLMLLLVISGTALYLKRGLS